jgi:glycosyltransferase involved in cell wall biosynthesis
MRQGEHVRISRGNGQRRRARVTVIQPYVPAYRVPFFNELSRLLALSGSELQVVHGRPESAQAERGDASTGPWSVPIKVRSFRLRGHILHWRRVLRLARDSDVIIAELASTNLDTYLLALLMHRRLMLWGHGKAYVTDASNLDRRLERWLAGRAQRVFVYTEGGATFLRTWGYEPERLTVVRNSTDTVALREAAAALTDADVAAYRQELGLGTGPVAVFIGSFDDSKGLPLLFAAAELVHDQVPGFRLIVTGAGPLQHLVDVAAQDSPFIIALPRTDGRGLAPVGRVAECLVVPGRVGLVAVDALALGLPVVTTSYAHHAPEAEYLTDDVRVTTQQSPESLAEGIVALLADRSRLAVAQATAAQLGEQLTIEAMAAAFAEPLIAAIGRS